MVFAIAFLATILTVAFSLLNFGSQDVTLWFSVPLFAIFTFYHEDSGKEASPEKGWSLERASRVSSKFALLYFVLSLIWIWIFGAKPEFVINPNWFLLINRKITLPFNSGVMILLNLWGIYFFGILIYRIIEHFFKKNEGVGLGQFLCSNEQMDKKVIRAINSFYAIGFFVWAGSLFGFALFIGVNAGLGIGALFGLILGFILFLLFVLFGVIAWAISRVFKKELWIWIGRKISLFSSWLIQ